MKKLIIALLLLSASAFAQTTCVNCGGNPYASGSGASANNIPKAVGSSGQLQDSLASDNGTTLTYTGTGGISAPSYAATGANGGISGTEGTGGSLTAGSGIDLLWPDSTAHRWKFNNNNGGADTVAGFTDKLSVFAATTSAELAGVISNETGGSGLLVFNSSPTIITPSFTTGFTIGGAATSGNVPVGNGTNFVSGQLAFSNLSGAATVAQLPAFQVDKQDVGGNIDGDSSDKTVYTYTMPTSTLGSGKCLRVHFAFTRTVGSGTPNMKIIFGATTVNNILTSFGAGTGILHAVVCNNAASTTAQWWNGFTTNSSSNSNGTAAETTASGTIVIKGTFNVASGTSISGRGWFVELIP